MKSFFILMCVFIWGAVIWLSQASFAQNAANPNASDKSKDIRAAIEQTPNILADRDSLGKKLHEWLLDDKIHLTLRLDCAKSLGKLKHSPAITDLIKLIDLRNLFGRPNDISIENTDPCVVALASYGIEAMPQIVEAYFRERDENRLSLLRMALHLGKTNREAAIYAQGLVGRKTDRETQNKLLLFLAAMRSPN
jgi:hypothetical protein